MARGRARKSRFTYRAGYVNRTDHGPAWDTACKVLARMVAELFAADHPELFGQVTRAEAASEPGRGSPS